MIVVKKFKCEAAHRISWREGKCKQLNGHSYKMIVKFEGEPDAKGFFIDFNEIKKIVEPHIRLIDHTTIISQDDSELKEIFENKLWKYFLLFCNSPAEYFCRYFSNLIIDKNRGLLTANNIEVVG